MRIPYTLAALAAAGALAAGTASAADDPAAMPVACDGVLIKDKAGDQVNGPIMGGPPNATSKGPDNVDIEAVWFNTVGGVTTANVQIADLNQTVPSGFPLGKFAIDVDFDNVGDVAWARAEISASAVSFYLVKVVGVTNSGKQEIKGKLFPGKHGVVQIELPADIFKPGMTLNNVFATSSPRSNDDMQIGYVNDTAPDDGATAKKNATLKECPAAAATPEATVTPPVVDTPPATQTAPPAQTQPGPAAQQQQPGPAAQPAPAKKKSAKAACKKKAKKLKGKKRARALKRCAKMRS